MRVFCTGSAGFIGTHLTQALQAGASVVQGIDLRTSALSSMVIGDVRELAANFVDSFDVCIHLASDVGGFLRNAANRGQVEYELELIHAVANLCRSKGCRRLIYASSIAVFEQADGFEQGPLRVRSQRTHYAMAKARGEKLVEALFDEFVIVRPTNVFGVSASCVGHHVGESHVIPDLLRKIHTNERLEVLGDGRQVRNFVHVDDVVRFLITVLQGPRRGWYNLRSNIQLSIAALAHELLEITGQRREVVFRPEYLPYEPRPIEAFDLTGPLALGWQPMISSLRQGLSCGATPSGPAQTASTPKSSTVVAGAGNQGLSAVGAGSTRGTPV